MQTLNRIYDGDPRAMVIRPTTIKNIRVFNGASIQVLGEITVSSKIKKSKINLNFIVINQMAQTIIGCKTSLEEGII